MNKFGCSKDLSIRQELCFCLINALYFCDPEI